MHNICFYEHKKNIMNPTQEQYLLKGKTVVITGASSGAGRAAAEAFALEGCNIILAARGQEGLDNVLNLCRDLGAIALAVPTDVSKPEDVKNLATQALQFNGRIDIWVNNAGIMATGKFEDMPVEAVDQIIKTNLLGYLHGAHTVLPIFKKQNDGILINNISIGGWVPTPFGTAYSASKYGLRGMVETLQGEYAEFPNIHICALYPGMLKSTGNSHSAKYSGLDFKVPPMALDPRKLASQMVELAKHPKNSILPDLSSFAMKYFYKIFPATFSFLSSTVVKLMMNPEKNQETNGNIFVPSSDPHRIYGETTLSSLSKHKNKILLSTILSSAAILLLFSRKSNK